MRWWSRRSRAVHHSFARALTARSAAALNGGTSEAVLTALCDAVDGAAADCLATTPGCKERRAMKLTVETPAIIDPIRRLQDDEDFEGS